MDGEEIHEVTWNWYLTNEDEEAIRAICDQYGVKLEEVVERADDDFVLKLKGSKIAADKCGKNLRIELIHNKAIASLPVVSKLRPTATDYVPDNINFSDITDELEEMMTKKNLKRTTNKLRFTLNGEVVEIENPDPQKLLVHWLRESGYTGTKFSCGQGGCGACTVNIQFPESDRLIAVNGCLRPLAAVHGMKVITVEGIGAYNASSKPMLDEVQKRIAEFNGTQCGYCTPGFVMGMNAYLKNTEKEESRTIVDIENLFDGHLCRCTGYRPILCGMKTFGKCRNEEELKQAPLITTDASKGYALGKLFHANVAVVDSRDQRTIRVLVKPIGVQAGVGPPTEPIEARFEIETRPVFVCKRGDAIWYGVSTLLQLKSLLQMYKEQRHRLRIVAGNTAYGIQPARPYVTHSEKRDSLGYCISKRNVFIFIGRTEELTILNDHGGNYVEVYCAVPIQRLQDCFKSHCDPDSEIDHLNPAAVAYNHLKRLATTEIRNVGSIGGNLYLGHHKKLQFPSDLLLVLATLGAEVVVADLSEENDVDDFEVKLLLGKKKIEDAFSTEKYSITEFLQEEHVFSEAKIIYKVNIPIKKNNNRFMYTYKVAKRPQNSHPIVNGGFSIEVDKEKKKFPRVSIFFGYHNKQIHEMKKTQEYMEDQDECSPYNLAERMDNLLKELRKEVEEDVSRMTVQDSLKTYITDTACNVFFKSLLKLLEVLELPGSLEDVSVPKSLVNSRFSETSSGYQEFTVYRDRYPVSEALIKDSAFIQATGEAIYTQDIGRTTSHLEGVFVLNLGKKARAHANFEMKIPDDFKQRFPCVVKVFTADDLKDPDSTEKDRVYRRNNLGDGQYGFNGDTIFAQNEVLYIGQALGMVVAKTEEEAREAATWLQENAVTYSDDHSPVVSFSYARTKENFLFDHNKKITTPDGIIHGRSRISKISRSGKEIDWEALRKERGIVVVKGSQTAASQYHFYMETQSAFAFPTEYGGIRVYSSTQSPSSTQNVVATACNLEMNQVTVEVPRLGGGYGGKEVQSKYTAAAAAVCAQQLNQPVRVALDRVEDMHMIGKRHAYFGNFKVAAYSGGKKKGVIKAIQFDFYSDGGCTYDATFPVMDLTLLTCDNAYNVPQFVAQGQCAMTNKATNTAFRSFGVVQTMIIVEAAIEAVAKELGIDEDTLRERNFYKNENDQPPSTPYGQVLHYCNLEGIWEQLKMKSEYAERKQKVQQYNKTHRYKKRGIKMLPLKYGISFTKISKNQASAIVSVNYKDGSILLTHGGVEMGQGLNTKLRQIAANVLNIPIDLIRINSTSTDKVPNAVDTGASTAPDLNGGAVNDACCKLRQVLEDLYVREGESDLKWYEVTDVESKVKTWKKVVRLAFDKRISLLSHGHFKSPNLTEVTDTKQDGQTPFYYFNYAAAVSEVEIDALTGEFSIVRSDIIYDAGHSLNPAIDIGQIEGGFVMGIGNVTTEELEYDEHGRLETDGTWEYKIPCTKTIPKDLRVIIYPGKDGEPVDRKDYVTHEIPVRIDPYGIQSSKTTGEPPLVLANTVFFAIRDAIVAARKEAGEKKPYDFTFDAPASVERIQQACKLKPCMQE